MAQVRFDILQFLKPEQVRLGIGGFYPSRIRRTPLVNLSTIFTYLITFVQVVSVVHFALTTTDLAKVSEILLFSLTQVSFVNKLINFHLKSWKLADLDETLEQDVFTNVNEEEEKILRAAFAKCQKILTVFLISCVFVTLMYGVAPLMDNVSNGRKNYPFPGKFPFNPDDYYVAIFLGEVTAVGISAWNNGSMDCLFAKHAVIATTLCKILRKRISTMLQTTEDDRTIEDKLKYCIIYYDEIISYVAKIQKIYSYGVLIQFLCSAIIICLTGFQLLVVSSKNGKIGLLLVYLTCMIIQLVLYCWYGHILTEESNGITMACYVIDWYELKVTNQKMLITLMERAKKPLGLQAMGVFRLNLFTLMKILRSSYSYFAVLQQIYKN